MKSHENKKIINDLLIVFIPPLIITIGTYFAQSVLSLKNVSIGITVMLSIIAYIVTAIIIFIYRTKTIRKYKEYEGRWIEIIPGFVRPITICHIEYKQDGYHFDGVNYDIKDYSNVKFSSKKFIASSRNEFYYITKNETDLRNVEGYGKVFALSNTANGYYEGQGYFIDVSSGIGQRIQNTYMIKFDEDFYDRLNIPHGDDPNNYTDRDVLDHVLEYVRSHYLEDTH